MIKKIFAVLLMACLLIPMVGCGKEKPKGNISFDSLEKMQECLNGKWFSVERVIYPQYAELVFKNNEIKELEVYGWTSENDVNEEGKIIGTKYELNKYEELEFKDYNYTSSTPQFKYKTGQVLFDVENLNINIKEYVNVADGKEIREKYLLIGSRVYFKATDKTELSCDNFKTFLKFCEVAINNKETNSFASMYYQDGDKKRDTEEGVDKNRFFIYQGCDSDEISFEISNREYSPTHYFARTDEFKHLYEEIKDLLGHRTNIIGLIGTEMPDFKKKDWAKNHRFKELDYYLYMNPEGKLVSNIS